MIDDIVSDVAESFEKLPEDIGLQAMEQIKGTASQQPKAQDKSQSQPGDDQKQQQWLNDLYGTSELTPEQLEQKKKQENRIKTQMYQKIQQDIQEYRAKKSQEVSVYEANLQQGTKAVTTQEEKIELWEEQKKKAEEAKKKQEEISAPGSQQSRSGEQGVVMG